MVDSLSRTVSGERVPHPIIRLDELTTSISDGLDKTEKKYFIENK